MFWPKQSSGLAKASPPASWWKGGPRIHRASDHLKQNRRPRAPVIFPISKAYELAFSTVTARRFCDQQEMSLHTATGRSLP
jgi:hypothetical protein